MRSKKTQNLVLTAMLTAIILLMAFTPIGYIKTLGVEITLIVVPVTVGAIVLGPITGAILGGVFGITSFIQCFGLSPFGATLLGINPISTFVLCIVPRILMGWLTGLIFVGLKKWDRTKGLSYVVTSLVGPLLNTVFFMSALVIFFYKTEYIQGFATSLKTGNAFAFVVAFVGLNGLIEAGACFILGTAISKAVDAYITKSGK